MITLHTFKVDVTPPIGGYLCGGLHDTALSVETPLYLRGIALTDGATRCVAAVIDFCYLCGTSHTRLLRAIADGAQLEPDRVTLHSNHVHDAPLIDEDAHALVAEYAPQFQLHDEAWFVSLLARCRDAVAQALADPGTPITGVAFSSHPVEQFASTRRVLDDRGQCQVRYSVCHNPEIRSAPEGLIDPMLDQIVFYDAGNCPVACASFYASHPQVSDGRRTVSSDTVGVALDLFEKTNPEVFPLYFTGCGGDITAGKYSTTNKHYNRLSFGLRLFEAMQSAFDKAQPSPIGGLAWKHTTLDLPLRTIPEDANHYADQIRSADWRPAKYLAAMKLHRLQQNITTYPYHLARLSFGVLDVLFLPSEMCIPYQLYAKQRCAAPLAVAAYGDSFLKYIATDEAFDQGGYEVQPNWTEIDRGVEPILKQAMDRILRSA
ncbi:MAG: hypothetical protein HZB26_20750 [Candidatus Hydrogenedentes bacterium]|nr:hypothetical protein [Candidatus Hydrogenedentota bacterium]